LDDIAVAVANAWYVGDKISLAVVGGNPLSVTLTGTPLT
jgi:hypothetical protein